MDTNHIEKQIVRDEINNLKLMISDLSRHDSISAKFQVEEFTKILNDKVEHEKTLYNMEKFARRCDATGKGINEGFVVGDGELYFASKDDLINHLRSRGGMEGLSDEFILNEAYELEEYYYTEWEEIDDDFYYDAEGNEYEL